MDDEQDEAEIRARVQACGGCLAGEWRSTIDAGFASGLGIQPSTLRARRRTMKGGHARPRPRARLEGVTTPFGRSPADLASQNAKPKRELDRTRIERAILKARRIWSPAPVKVWPNPPDRARDKFGE